MDVVYDIKHEQSFDTMVAALKAMPNHQQQDFAKILQGIMIGIQLEREKHESHLKNNREGEQNTQY
mgnify:CR=1 FL=1